MLQGKKGHLLGLKNRFSLVLFQVIDCIRKTRFYASKAQEAPLHCSSILRALMQRQFPLQVVLQCLFLDHSVIDDFTPICDTEARSTSSTSVADK